MTVNIINTIILSHCRVFATPPCSNIGIVESLPKSAPTSRRHGHHSEVVPEFAEPRRSVAPRITRHYHSGTGVATPKTAGPATTKEVTPTETCATTEVAISFVDNGCSRLRSGTLATYKAKRTWRQRTWKSVSQHFDFCWLVHDGIFQTRLS